jgi:hypothetical protein
VCSSSETFGKEESATDVGSGAQVVYEVFFTEEERKHLGKLKGQVLETITSDGWAYFLKTGNGLLQVGVLEEATPDESHRAGDVTRPQIGLGKGPAAPHETPFDSPAHVEGVSILRTVVTMSPPERVEGESLHGVKLPPSTAYGPLYIHPDDERLPTLTAQAQSGNALSLSWLDIGFRMHLRDGDSVTVHTDGATFFPAISRGTELDRVPSDVIQEIPV